MSLTVASSPSTLPHWCEEAHTPPALPIAHLTLLLHLLLMPQHLVLIPPSLLDLLLYTGWLLLQLLPVPTSTSTWKWTLSTVAIADQQRVEFRTVPDFKVQTQVRVPVATAQVRQVMGESSCYGAQVERLWRQHNWCLNSSSTSITCSSLRTEATRFTGLGDQSSAGTLEGILSRLCTLAGDNSSDQCCSSCLYSWL